MNPLEYLLWILLVLFKMLKKALLWAWNTGNPLEVLLGILIFLLRVIITLLLWATEVLHLPRMRHWLCNFVLRLAWFHMEFDEFMAWFGPFIVEFLGHHQLLFALMITCLVYVLAYLPRWRIHTILILPDWMRKYFLWTFLLCLYILVLFFLIEFPYY